MQKRFNKLGGNVAYHAYQSFKRGEVTPEVAHKVGVELAEKMWGDEYQVLVATHFNTGTYHNHFVVNSVNMWTGKKFNCNKGAYYRLRGLSDEICKEHGLYVIENPSGKTPRNIYFAEKNKEPTKFNLMREAIDFAITCSGNHNDFRKIMRELGYVVELNPNRTYWTIRSLNSKKNVRMFRLGEDYTNQRILERMRAEGNNRFQKGYEFWDERKALRRYEPKKIYLNGSLKDSRKITGLKAFYLLFATLLGLYPKRKCGYTITTPKTKAGIREIPMFEEVREALLSEYERQKTVGFNEMVIDGYSGFVFRNRFGRVFNPNNLNRAIERIIREYNAEEEEKAKAEGRMPIIIPHFSVHNLRHTFCTRMCENTSDKNTLKMIQEIMGHSDISTTLDIYTELKIIFV